MLTRDDKHTLESGQTFEVTNQRLGTGICSAIFLAIDIVARTHVAAKRTSRFRVRNEEKALEVLNGHPRIVHFLGSVQNPTQRILFLELAQGDLLDIVQANAGVSEEDARQYCSDMVSALEHCHDHGFSHLDVKPENMLVFSDGRIKLTDFGSAMHVSESFSNKFYQQAGTPSYMPPEILQPELRQLGYEGPPADVWSLGVTLFSIIANEFPFLRSDSATCPRFKLLSVGSYTFPAKLSAELQSMLLSMWELQPAERLSLPQVTSSQWLMSKVDEIDSASDLASLSLQHGSIPVLSNSVHTESSLRHDSGGPSCDRQRNPLGMLAASNMASLD